VSFCLKAAFTHFGENRLEIPSRAENIFLPEFGGGNLTILPVL